MKKNAFYAIAIGLTIALSSAVTVFAYDGHEHTITDDIMPRFQGDLEYGPYIKETNEDKYEFKTISVGADYYRCRTWMEDTADGTNLTELTSVEETANPTFKTINFKYGINRSTNDTVLVNIDNPQWSIYDVLFSAAWKHY